MFTVDDVLTKHYPSVANYPLLSKPLTFLLKRLLHEREMHEFAQLYPHVQGIDFVEQVLDYFKISYSVRDVEKQNIPSEGRLVIIANHPIGSLDALALIKLVAEIRTDIKVIANQLLMALVPLQPLLLPVNNMQGGTPKEHIQKIQQHLEKEGIVIVFPAGEVSRLRPQGIRDTVWQSGFLRIAKQSKSPILPVFIDAKNSPLFYSLSMVYKPLAAMLLVTEMFKQQHKHLPIRIGEVIPLDAFNSVNLRKKHQVLLFKKHLYKIGHDKAGIFKTQKPIALPEKRVELIHALKKNCERLGATVDGKIIYLYQHVDSSPIMREIGRLREIAFRAVGEGTNKKRDLDQYDQDYFQLILWDPEELEIAGAYRFGDAKKLIQSRGLKGIYSSTLFDYGPGMDKYFEQGLELGRSFVQPKYWGKRSLDYLWYGIGAFLQRHPQYRYLFGPVSMSNNYPAAAKDLLVTFYTLYFKHPLATAKSKTPYIIKPTEVAYFVGNNYQQDFSTLKHLLANMGVAVPILYKQYTETYEEGGVHFINFNVDPDFSDCIDGLILADVCKLKAKKRKRYMPSTVVVSKAHALSLSDDIAKPML